MITAANVKPGFSYEDLIKLVELFNAESKALLIDIVTLGVTPEREEQYKALLKRESYLRSLAGIFADERAKEREQRLCQQLDAVFDGPGALNTVKKTFDA